MAGVGVHGVKNKNAGMGRPDQNSQDTTEHVRATEELFGQVQHAIDLIEPTKDELKQLYSQKGKEKTFPNNNATEEIKRLREKVNAQSQEHNQEYTELFDKLHHANSQIEGFEEMWKKRENELLQKHKEAIDAYKEVNMKTEETLQYEKTKLEDKIKETRQAARTRIEEMKQDKRDTVERIQREKKQIEEELTDTKTRLSRLMGNKITDNNPNIADLSDKNRPTKIAEKYQELYDNQWTDAYEVAEQHFPDMDERHRTTVLVKILMEINNFCKDEKSAQNESLMQVLFLTNNEEGSGLTEDINKQLKDIRRRTATNGIPHITQKYLNTVAKSTGVESYTHSVKEYVHECVTLCWLMLNQDPPLVFRVGVKQGDAFDSNEYKAYTVTGEVVEFVVWPPLLLHEKGPLLAKGVAQCKKSSRLLDGSKSVRTRSSKLTVSDMLGGSLRVHMPGEETGPWHNATTPDGHQWKKDSMTTNTNSFDQTSNADKMNGKTYVIGKQQNLWNTGDNDGNNATSSPQRSGTGLSQSTERKTSTENRNSTTGTLQQAQGQPGSPMQWSQNDTQTQRSSNNSAGQSHQQQTNANQSIPPSSTQQAHMTDSNNQLQSNQAVGNPQMVKSQQAQQNQETQSTIQQHMQMPSSAVSHQQPVQNNNWTNPHNNAQQPNIPFQNTVYSYPTLDEMQHYYIAVNQLGYNGAYNYLGAVLYDKCARYHNYLYPPNNACSSV